MKIKSAKVMEARLRKELDSKIEILLGPKPKYGPYLISDVRMTGKLGRLYQSYLIKRARLGIISSPNGWVYKEET